MANIKKDFQFYLDNQEKLLDQYKDKYIVIKNCKVIGSYDSETEAIEETSKMHALGTFIVQKCELGNSSYTMTFHSRVQFF